MAMGVLALLLLLVVATEASSPSAPPAAFRSLEEHERRLEGLVQALRGRTKGQRVALQRSVSQSHCPRPQSYKRDSLLLSISGFDKVLSLSPVQKTQLPRELQEYFDSEVVDAVDVQACMSFEALVDALLPLGRIPAVVPEFKGITVGGSLQGLAAESTSFKYGFVHDCIIGFEAVLADGSVLWCDARCNADLFKALPGSFGSLAICTRVRMLCVKAAPYVLVTCVDHASHGECIQHMASEQTTNQRRVVGDARLDFLEGLCFSSTSTVAVKGVFATDEQASSLRAQGVRLGHCNGWGNKWFYNQARDLVRSGRGRMLLPTADYLFRHDQGSFWMASYRIPQAIGRIMGRLLDSSAMFLLANLLPVVFPKRSIVLQDFMMPGESVEQFLSDLHKLLRVYPVWLLPMRNIESKGVIFGGPPTKRNFCNVGVYGIPKGRYDFVSDNRALEALMFRHGGRKVYYSHAFHSRRFFYEALHDGRAYFALRRKYGAEEAFPEVYDKIVTKNNQL